MEHLAVVKKELREEYEKQQKEQENAAKPEVAEPTGNKEA